MVRQTELFQELSPSTPKRGRKGVSGTAKAKTVRPRGCSVCPLNLEATPERPPGSVFGKVQGKPVLVIAMCPGGTEVRTKLPLTGKAGQLLWKEMAAVGKLRREDCDIDNVVRCRPTQISEAGNTIDRPPTKEELWCCSVHTEAQMGLARPKVVLLLGRVAQQQILGRMFKKDKEVYQHPTLRCPTVCGPHPAYLLRGAPQEGWKALRSAIEQVRAVLDGQDKPYWETQDYKVLNTEQEVGEFFQTLEQENKTLSVDIEHGINQEGKQVILCIGFSNRTGRARVVFYDHPQIVEERKQAGQETLTERLKARTCRFLAKEQPKKLGWHFVSDCMVLKERWGVEVRGYRAEAMFQEYLIYPERKDYRLERVAEVRFKQFAGWKQIVDPYVGTPPNYANVPPEVLTLRCAGDADLTLRAYLTTRKAPQQLLEKLLIPASFVFYGMEERGVRFDMEHAQNMLKVYEPLEKKLVQRIALTAGQVDFDPTDENLAWLLTEKLRLKITEYTPKKKRVSVAKAVLEKLIGKHPVIQTILALKFVRKLLSTYVTGFIRSAKLNQGFVRTRWKITGTRSGRPASGGERYGTGKDKEDVDKVNLQNVHGDTNAQNMLISSPRWREIEQAYEQAKQRSDSV